MPLSNLFVTKNVVRDQIKITHCFKIPNEDPTDIGNKDLIKRQKHMQRCKEEAWKICRNEYLTWLRERHNLKQKEREPEVKLGEVVVIKSDERNKAQWKLGIITEVYLGRDCKVRAVRLRAVKL